MGAQLTEIATLLIGLALVSMLVTRSRDTATVIQAGSTGFGHLLSVATMQNASSFGYGAFPRF